jgi:prevent-host-death family protein
MDASIRDLKANLSGLIRRVQAGETVTVRVRSRPVARIVPLARRDDAEALARIPGLRWKGGKPAGLERAERLPRDLELSRLVSEDRR